MLRTLQGTGDATPQAGPDRDVTALPANSVAEGVGFEPTVGCPTMVFETIRFGRSRIPPPGSVPRGLHASSGVRRRCRAARLATRGEEAREQRRRFLGAHAGVDRERVVEPRVGTERVERLERARLRVAARRTPPRSPVPQARRPRTSGTARGSRPRCNRRDASSHVLGAASRNARISACAVGSSSCSRSLCRRAMISPVSSRATTAPTGTSACSSARALRRAPRP